MPRVGVVRVGLTGASGRVKQSLTSNRPLFFSWRLTVLVAKKEKVLKHPCAAPDEAIEHAQVPRRKDIEHAPTRDMKQHASADTDLACTARGVSRPWGTRRARAGKTLGTRGARAPKNRARAQNRVFFDLRFAGQAQPHGAPAFPLYNIKRAKWLPEGAAHMLVAGVCTYAGGGRLF